MKDIKQSVSNIKADVSYWREACDFTKTFLSKDVEKRFVNYCKKRKFNDNEKLFFRKMVGDAVDFTFNMALLKDSCNKATDPVIKETK
jgi:hypothetical protein